jgi:hypothetical protein
MESVESPNTFTLRRSHSGWSLLTSINSVVQTGVKSAGCEKRMAQASRFHSRKDSILPAVVSDAKSGAMSPIRRDIVVSSSVLWLLFQSERFRTATNNLKRVPGFHVLPHAQHVRVLFHRGVLRLLLSKILELLLSRPKCEFVKVGGLLTSGWKLLILNFDLRNTSRLHYL